MEGRKWEALGDVIISDFSRVRRGNTYRNLFATALRPKSPAGSIALTPAYVEDAEMNTPEKENNNETAGERRGAVGVIVRSDRLLVIERSQTVRAPGRLCFPGGGIEAGETDEEAVRRELTEELNVDTTPLRCVWQNATQSGVLLYWWLVELAGDQQPVANPTEVADWFWMTPDEIAAHPDTLETNREFVRCLKRGEICLDI